MKLSLSVMSLAVPSVLAFVMLSCSSSPNKPEPTSATDPTSPEVREFEMSMEVTAPPHEETWKCQIGKLPVEGAQAVHAVKHVQSKSIHHMDIMILLSSGLERPPGIYDCGPLYKEYPKLMEETILYAAQNENGDIVLPPGIAALVPGFLTVMFELHHVNTTDKEEKLFSKVTASTIPPEEVTGGIWGGAVRDRNLNIAPRSETNEWSRCTFNEDVDVLFLSSHTHELGQDVRINMFDGKTTGEEVFRNDDWASPVLKAFDKKPIHRKKGEGFQFNCHYKNPRDTEVKWGFEAKDEMCNMAVVFTPGDPNIKCKVIETSDGVIFE